MMMFSFHIALTLSLISLASGFFLLQSSEERTGSCAAWGKFFGYVITILSILSIICTLVSGYRVWKEGYMDSHFLQEIHQKMLNSKTS